MMRKVNAWKLHARRRVVELQDPTAVAKDPTVNEGEYEP